MAADPTLRAGYGFGAPNLKPKFVGYVPRPNEALFPAIPVVPRPQPTPLSDSALALIASVFRAASPVKVNSPLEGMGWASHSAAPTLNLEYRLCRTSAQAAGPASSTDGAGGPNAQLNLAADIGKDVLLQSVLSRQGLVQFQTQGETSLSHVIAGMLKGSNGQGVKLSDQLSIQSIKKATSYKSGENVVAVEAQSSRTRWIVTVYDADLKDTFEMPLTEIQMAQGTPESFSSNLPLVKEAMDAHLNAIHWAYKDSVSQPTVLSLAVPEWAGLLAGFEDAQTRILGGCGYTVREIVDSTENLYSTVAPRSDALNQMLEALLEVNLSQPQCESAVAKLSSRFNRPDFLEPDGQPGVPVTQSADSIRRSRHHLMGLSSYVEDDNKPADALDNNTPTHGPRGGS